MRPASDWTPLPFALTLARRPTPIERLGPLSAELGLDVWVKRDDLTGSHLSGNKVRKLDFLLADALASESTHVLTCGGIQSNHARATALAARPLGLEAVLLLRTPQGLPSDLPSPPTGNVLLDRLAGARIETISPEAYRSSRNERLAALADTLTAEGHRPYIVPEGGSNALGALGYVACAREIATQLAELGAPAPDAIVAATGSGGTLAGLALGLEDLALPTTAIGVAVCDDAPYFERIVETLAIEAGARFGLPVLSERRFVVLDAHVGEGYARTTPSELAFLADTLRRHGLLLDPVYTNKGLLGLVHTLRHAPGTLTRDGRPPRSVVFIHTGGVFGLFGHTFSAAELATL